jgi:STE24 endopeptidase
MFRFFAALALCFSLQWAHAQESSTPPAAPPAVSATVQTAPAAVTFDPAAATREFMNRLQGEARIKSDNYAEGGYWLTLWNLLLGLLVSWLLLSQRISARMRDFANHRTSNKNLQVFIYAVMFLVLVSLLTFPMALYAEFYREHQYGLSNLSLTAWLGEQAIALGVNTLLMGIALTGLYAILRRVPGTWWAWGALAGTGFMVIVVMISPVFLAPLLNTYKPVPEGPAREAVLSLARANGIPADNIYYFDASKQTKRISANVSGLFGTTRISLNDNLLERTSLPEIKAVMAHEMGHYVLNHSLKLTLNFSLLLLGGFLFLRWSWDWASRRFGTRFGVIGIADPAGLPLLIALFSVYFFLATPISNTIIRTEEIEADMFGLNASREPDGFAEAIFKLAEYRKLEPGAIEEILFFDHPSGYSRIYSAMRWKAENLPK